MKQLFVFLTLLLGSTPFVAAADFRGFNFGEDCRSVAAAEKGRGSIQQSNSGGDVLYFSGAFEGWRGQIAYICDGGELRQGAYLFELDSFEAATNLYMEIKALLIRMYGKPIVDFSAPRCIAQLERDGRNLGNEDKYVAVWEVGGVSIDLMAVAATGQRSGMVRLGYVPVTSGDEGGGCV
jgi:hypothetical protein